MYVRVYPLSTNFPNSCPKVLGGIILLLTMTRTVLYTKASPSLALKFSESLRSATFVSRSAWSHQPSLGSLFVASFLPPTSLGRNQYCALQVLGLFFRVCCFFFLGGGGAIRVGFRFGLPISSPTADSSTFVTCNSAFRLSPSCKLPTRFRVSALTLA